MYNGTTDLFDGCEFPATREDLLRAVEGEEIELPNGRASAAEAIARGGGDSFETREDARFALYSGVGRDAVGRSHYSDRDPTTPGGDGPRPVSF